MTIIKNCVLLLKAQKSHDILDKFEVTLKSNNYNVVQIKTLDFVYSNLNELEEKLKRPDDYSGIVFSSPRCVIAAHQAIESGIFNQKWHEKHNFVVGETTFDVTLKMLGLKCHGRETGNANSLADLIIKGKANFRKPFLFPHGNLKTDTLKHKFQPEGLALEEVLVYETISNPNMREELAVVTSNFTRLPEIIIFFSPSGVKNTIELIQQVTFDLKSVKFIAIGPVTEAAMIEEGIKVDGVASKPTPEDVLKAISC